MAEQVFKDIKIADFSWVGVGPQVGREFAAHGATVVRVESHNRPDQLRLIGPFKDMEPGIDRSAFGTCFNTGKYGISVDLKTEKGQEVGRKLVKWADIVCDSMTPGSMERLGLDYENLKQIKPEIIMFSTCQYGHYGPYSNLPGYGQMGAAMAGASNLVGWPDREPAGAFGAYTDFIAPWFLIPTVIGALLYRNKTGQGVFIDMAQVEAASTFISPLILDYTVNGRVAQPMGNSSPTSAPHGVFPCLGEDKWVAISVSTDSEWEAFCQVIGHPDWTGADKFQTLEGRRSNEPELNELVGEWTKQHTPARVMSMLQERGVPAGVVENCHEDLFDDPQLKHRRHFRFLEHQVMGTHAYNAPAYILSKTPNNIHKAGPTLGEDNEYVFKEILKYTDDEIADFLIEGVITTDADLG
ncbi:MAG: CoA transferase [Candidatus Adiutricales bacterium]